MGILTDAWISLFQRVRLPARSLLFHSKPFPSLKFCQLLPLSLLRDCGHRQPGATRMTRMTGREAYAEGGEERLSQGPSRGAVSGLLLTGLPLTVLTACAWCGWREGGEGPRLSPEGKGAWGDEGESCELRSC